MAGRGEPDPSAAASGHSPKSKSLWPDLDRNRGVRSGDGEDRGKEGRRTWWRASSSETTPEGAEICRRWKSSSPFLLRSEMASNHSEADVDLGRGRIPAPTSELPLRGFIVAHRRLCLFSDENKAVGCAAGAVADRGKDIRSGGPFKEGWWLAKGFSPCEVKKIRPSCSSNGNAGEASTEQKNSTTESADLGATRLSLMPCKDAFFPSTGRPSGTSQVAVEAERRADPPGVDFPASSEVPSCQVEDPPEEAEEERSRLVKRLKRPGSPEGGAGGEQRLCSRVMNYGRSSSFTLARSLQERRQLQRTMLLLRSGEAAAVPEAESPAAESLHLWIRRWRRKGPPEPEAERAEGHPFPSVAAMALVGKAISNFRPCKFQRRGSSLVWNTDEL